MNRFHTQAGIGIATSQLTSGVIFFGEFTMGTLHIPSTETTLTTLTWYSCDTEDGTYLPLRDQYGNTVVQTVAHTNAYAFPDAVAGAAFLKIKGNVASTAVSLILKA